jgi:general L-amino acid transport system permease protein
MGLRVGPRVRWLLLVGWLASPFIILFLLRGFAGSTTLPRIETGLWGGLMLTILLAVTGIVASFPLGVLLALGRRSRLPVVKGFCVAYIEIIRGVPLISVLFMAMIMLPLFLPQNVRVDALIRVMVAITLFSAAYLAENVRGGLQSIPNGQVEAARALGLNVFQSTLLIVLPQALRAVIPAIVGQFISLFKDTSLVFIVGLIDLLGIADAVIHQPEWLTVTGGVQREVLLFAAFIYWVFCFTMSRVSRRIETNLGVGTR